MHSNAILCLRRQPTSACFGPWLMLLYSAQMSCTLPPPCKPPPFAISPPHPGDRHFHVFLVNMYCAGLCCPSALRMALHCFQGGGGGAQKNSRYHRFFVPPPP